MKKTLTLTGAALLVAAGSASAAIITDLDAAWPTGAPIQTVDALSDTSSSRGVTSTRTIYQSFVAGADTTVDTIYLSVASYGDYALNLQVLAVSNSLDHTTFASGVDVSGVISVPAYGSTGGAGTIEVDVSAESFALVSGQSYAISLNGGDAAGSSLSWAHSHTGVDHYTDGIYLRDDGSTHATRDFGVAMIPEPSTIGLVGAFGVGVVFLRRRLAW